MINLSQMVHEVEKLPPEHRQAVANLVDLKTENDVERVLNKLDAVSASVNARIDALETKFDAKIDAVSARIDALETKLDAKIDAVSTRIDAIETKFDAKIDALDTKFDNKFRSLYWFLGAIVVLFPLSPTINKLIAYLSSMIPS